MTDLKDRLQNLNPRQRELLLKKLKAREGSQPSAKQIVSREDASWHPMSSAQKRLWFLQQMEPGSAFYNLPSAIRIEGPLDEDLLYRSLQEVFRRHEVLRASFPIEASGEPGQLIHEPDTLPLEHTDLSALPEAQREQELHRCLTRQAGRVFSLETFPLFDLHLFRLDSQCHVLGITMHHIIIDGWSLGVFIQDFTRLYQGLVEEGPAFTLPQVPLQYSDYVAWLLRRSRPGRQEEELEFWRDYLQGMPQVLELISDKARPAVQTYNGRHHRFDLSQDLSTRLRRLARREQVSLYVLLMTAFQLFLHKLTGQQDFGVGAPIANRTRAELEGIVGYFVNTMVLRAALSQDLSFRELVKRVKADVAAVSDHQQLPFERIVEELAPQHEISHSPLFQVMFDLQQVPFRRLRLAGLEITIEAVEVEVAKFDLLMLVMDDQQRLQVTLEYNTDLFHTDSIRRFGAYFQTLLEQICSDPGQPLKELSLIRPKEAQVLLNRWNQTERPYPRERAVNQIFEQVARRHPRAVALEFEHRAYSFAQLDKVSNQLARRLIQTGVRPDDTVALFMERRPQLFIAILAILKAGGVYVPLDTAYPVERVRFMLEDSQSRLLLSQERLLSGFSELPINTLDIDLLLEESQGLDETPPKVTNSGDSRAYIIYTSGSTGTPKGVVVPHRAISRLVINTDYIDLQAGERMAQVNNVTFDAATMEIWGSLLTGGTLVGIPKEVVLDTKHFIHLLKDLRIDHMILTTALFNQIAGIDPTAFGTLKTVMFGGEAADPVSTIKIHQTVPPEYLINVYGPTENTTFSTVYRVTVDSKCRTMIPIGPPIANSTCFVLDDYLQPCPVGIPGELYVGGDGLAVGYHKRPELTAENFMPNPWSAQPGERMYKTGDLVRYLEDGNLEFLARIDHQVKLRGFRVELGEIESVLKSRDDIHDVVVLLNDQKTDKQLAAYYVPEPETEVNLKELRSFLLEKVPDYMVPVSYFKLEAIPLTPNGKVDKQALLSLKQDRPDFAAEYTPPRNALEEYLVGIWKEMLELDQVGIHDNFFELGGTSLKAAVFINRLQKDLNREAHVAAIFKAPRIADFAAYMLEYYPDLVREHFGELQTNGLELSIGKDDEPTIKKLTADDVKTFRQIIVPYPLTQKKEPKNPRAVFVLSPPRSGSTLLRVMLAGNKALFSPPELDLLSFRTLEERYREFTENNLEIWLESTIRSLMEIYQLDFEAARAMMREKETSGMTTKDFYAFLQRKIGQRLLVDKTPSYPFDLNILKRAEAEFEQPYYIHLIRHPYAMIYSFIEAKLDQNFFRYPHPFSRRQLAELIWLVSHQNILAFKKQIPEERFFSLQFEQLLQAPGEASEALCRFLGVDFDQDMLKPYQGDKMTDAVRKNSQMVGDFKFYLHRSINTRVIDRWKEYHREDFLSDGSWQMAETLGYPVEKETAIHSTKLSQIPTVSRDDILPLSYAQERLWFIDQLEPNSPMYNIPAAIKLSGELDLDCLKKSITEICKRHETLRTTFHQTKEGQAYQKIHEYLPSEYFLIDLKNQPSVSSENTLSDIISGEARKTFNLESGPLVRFTIVRLDNDKHIMIMVLHHIISDGWSLNVIVSELSYYYNQIKRNNPFELSPLEIQYADYAAWQRDWLDQDLLKTQKEYWKKKLEGIPERITLPVDYPRPLYQSANGTRYTFRLSKHLTDRINSFCKEKGSTLFSVLMTVFQVLLHRYSNQDDIVVGTPTAYRNRPETESMIGFFVNTLVIRTLFKPDSSFNELLEQVQSSTLEAFSNQDIPFEKLVDDIQPNRNMEHSPIFQTMFTLDSSSFESIQLEGLKLSSMSIDSGTSKFDLLLTMVLREGTLRGEMEYNTDLFAQQTIERMVKHLELLLETTIENAALPVGQLPMLSETESKLLLKEWVGEHKVFTASDTLHNRVEQQVKQNPEAIALTLGEENLTYFEMNGRANQLARHLKSIGIENEDIVAIYMERRIDLIIAILAVLKCGAGYLPMDPVYPEDRLAYMLNDSDAALVITENGLVEKLPGSGRTVINMDADQNSWKNQSEDNPEYAVDDSNIAYVIYTSGSTGFPKGTLISHFNVLRLMDSTSEWFKFNSSDVWTLFHSYAFDFSVWEIWGPLHYGGRLVIVPYLISRTPEAFYTLLVDEGVTVLNQTPSSFRQLIWAEENLIRDGNEMLDSLRYVIFGGEALELKSLKAWIDKHGDAHPQLINMYGITETTVHVTYRPLTRHDVEHTQQSVIGKPIPDLQLFILNPFLEPTPIGVPGEICVAGAGLARGYLNRPDLTSTKFISNPYSETAGDRLYRSGDLARFLPNGDIEYLGRIDSQVKIRGFRIELGEIDSHLNGHDAVQEAITIARKDDKDETQIVAYVVCEQNAKPTITELRQYLSVSVPDYMIPSAFVFLDSFPLTPNGKINKKALPEPQFKREELGTRIVHASNETEKALVEIWKQILHIKEIGVEDNFFELGGDSISSIQVIARAAQAGIQLTPRQLFEHPTIAGLALVAGKSGIVEAEQGSVTGLAPLTPIQHWFFEQQLQQQHHWNQSIMLEVTKPLDPEKLALVVRQIIDHHDVLRLTFNLNEEPVRQIFNETMEDIPYTFYNFSAHRSENQLKLVQETVSELQGSLNLEKGPLLNIAYFKLTDPIHDRLFITVHHLAIDGVSWRILMEDIRNGYMQLENAKTVVLPPKTSSYKAWAMNLRDYLVNNSLKEEINYWRKCSSVPAEPLVNQTDSHANLEETAKEYRLTLSKEITDKLKEQVVTHFNVQLIDVLLSGLLEAAHLWKGRESLLLALEGHGREDLLDGIDLSRTMGWFTTIYPVHFDIRGKKKKSEILNTIKEQRRAVPSNGFHYNLLRYFSPDPLVRQELAKIPEPEIVFNYLGQFDRDRTDEKMFIPKTDEKGLERSLENTRRFLLDISASIIDDRLVTIVTYSSVIFTPETIQQFGDYFEKTLSDFIEAMQYEEFAGYSASDFKEANIDDEDFDDIMSELNENQD